LAWPPNKVAAALILMVVLLLLMQELMLLLLPWVELVEARRRNEITRAQQQQSVN